MAALSASDGRLNAAEAEIARRARQQAAVAELGQAALARVDVGLLVGQTCAVVEWALGASYVSIVQASDNHLDLRFGLGSNTTFSNCNDAAPEHTPLLLCTLTLHEPFVFRNVIADARVNRDHLRDVHGVDAGVCIPIPGRDRAFGLLTVYSDTDRTFAEDELEFLRAVADLTGAVIMNAENEAARQQAEEARASSEDRFRALVENASEGIALIDARGTFLYTGPSTQRVLGYHERELVGRNFGELVHPDDLETARKNLRLLVSAEDIELTGELRLQNQSGEWRWIEGTYKNLLFNPSVRAIVINYRDVTERRLAEETLQHLAYRDTLTELPNRFLFHDRLEHALEQGRRRGTGVAVMYVDLDRFKVVNDTLGHTVGDHLLQVVARRLRDVLRSDDTIARLGGDEFAVILPEVGRAEDAGSVGRKLIAALRSPIIVDGHELHVTASCGVAIYPSDGLDVVTLIKHADAALYRSKDSGRNNVQLFASSMNRRYSERLELELALHRAVDRDEFTLVYQPLIDRKTRKLRSLEALVRWNRPGYGQVSPADFISLAEETRLVLPIGEWVMRTACEQLRAWRDAGLDDFFMGVNLSAHQVAQPQFIHQVHDTVRAAGLEPCDLELEITESAALQNLEWTLSVLDQLRTLGVGIAVDDFGTGQSSLVYLKRFPLTTLKIDREFLRDVQREASDAAIFRSIVQLGHSLGLYVVAEGIENGTDRQLVEEQACDGMQGYLFSRPLAAEAVPEWVRSFRYPEGDGEYEARADRGRRPNGASDRPHTARA
ncbi:MAG TPA: EAL domain-containing protein [Thermoanaerobaculia bacterium]|nr:EAL domain-containing protein [Thermoanaerobaculia bacterium]